MMPETGVASLDLVSVMSRMALEREQADLADVVADETTGDFERDEGEMVGLDLRPSEGRGRWAD